MDRRLAVWANRFVFNVAQLKFVDVFPQVDAARRGLDNASLALQAEADAQYVAGASMSAISASFRGHADAIVAAWWRLFEELMLRHGDGRGPSGYPAWWFRSDDVGYTSGPRSDRALMASAKPPEGHADGPELCLASRCGLSGSTGQQVDAACLPFGDHDNTFRTMGVVDDKAVSTSAMPKSTESTVLVQFSKAHTGGDEIYAAHKNSFMQ